MLVARIVVGIFSINMLVLGSLAFAQDYPAKPIRIYAGAAGGGGDFTGRLVAQGISPSLGQPVIVENRANGVIAAEVVSKSPPDGYALALGGGSTWTFQLLQKAPYDVVRDFTGVSLLVREVFIIAAHPSLPVKSIK